jgi:hypothetical protein
MRMEAGIDVGNGLRGVPEQDGMDAHRLRHRSDGHSCSPFSSVRSQVGEAIAYQPRTRA